MNETLCDDVLSRLTSALNEHGISYTCTPEIGYEYTEDIGSTTFRLHLEPAEEHLSILATFDLWAEEPFTELEVRRVLNYINSMPDCTYGRFSIHPPTGQVIYLQSISILERELLRDVYGRCFTSPVSIIRKYVPFIASVISDGTPSSEVIARIRGIPK